MPTPVIPLDAEVFAKLSQRLLAGQDAPTVLRDVVELAVQTIEPCDFAGISMRYGRSQVGTAAMTDPVVARADTLQYTLGEGPCLDALYIDDVYVIEDLQVEDRWPNWAPAAAELGLASVLSVRLETPDRVVGGLNLYSAQPYGYREDDVVTAQVYAMHAGSAIRQTQDKDGLRVALSTRHQIGIAQGLLMARYEVPPETAFQVLRRISSHENVKIRVVAAAVMEHQGRLGDLPWRSAAQAEPNKPTG
jgi:GAF domain-containing protein